MEVETAKARPSDVAESPNSNQEIHEDTNFQNDENGDEFANADDLDADDDQEDARALQLIQARPFLRLIGFPRIEAIKNFP